MVTGTVSIIYNGWLPGYPIPKQVSTLATDWLTVLSLQADLTDSIICVTDWLEWLDD